jgi:hypothetical protein
MGITRKATRTANSKYKAKAWRGLAIRLALCFDRRQALLTSVWLGLTFSVSVLAETHAQSHGLGGPAVAIIQAWRQTST